MFRRIREILASSEEHFKSLASAGEPLSSVLAQRQKFYQSADPVDLIRTPQLGKEFERLLPYPVFF